MAQEVLARATDKRSGTDANAKFRESILVRSATPALGGIGSGSNPWSWRTATTLLQYLATSWTWMSSSSTRLPTKRELATTSYERERLKDTGNPHKLSRLLQSFIDSLHPAGPPSVDSAYASSPTSRAFVGGVDGRRNARFIDPAEIPQVDNPAFIGRVASPTPSTASSYYTIVLPPSPTAFNEAMLPAWSTPPEQPRSKSRLALFPRRQPSHNTATSSDEGSGSGTARQGTGSKLIPRIKDAFSSPNRLSKRRKRKMSTVPPVYQIFDEPLDGEEGELVEDEACYIDICVQSGTDILSMLPDELSVQILLFLDLPDIQACLGVSRHWRRLATDRLIWRSFYLRAGFGIDMYMARRQVDGISPLVETSLPASMVRGRSSPPISLVSNLGIELALTHRGSISSIFTAQSSIGGSSCIHLPLPPLHNPNSVPLNLDWQSMYRARVDIERRLTAVPPKRTFISGHTDVVYCVEFDGKNIVTGSRDRTIKVWSARTGRLKATYRGHEGSVLCVQFDKTGLMISGSSDKSIAVWNMNGKSGLKTSNAHDDERLIARLYGHVDNVLDLKMDEKWIISCSRDSNICVWDRSTLTLFQTLVGHQGPVNAIGLQDGRVASASGDSKIILWNILTGERIRTFEAHGRGLACVEFKGNYLISGGKDCKITVWSVLTGECLQTLSGHEDLVRSLSYDPGTMRLVSGGYDKSVRVWDLKNGKCIRVFENVHDSNIFAVAFRVSKIISASHDKRICIMDFAPDTDVSLFA